MTTTTFSTGPFGPAADPAPVGDESVEWALWLTATGAQHPMPDHITALITASQHTARTAQSPDSPDGQAVVLHHGRVWAPDAPAASGTVQPTLLWSARCSVCGAEFDEEYGYYPAVDAALEQAVDGGWSEPGGGYLVCDGDDRAHHAARAAQSGPAPITQIQGQPVLPGLPADSEPVHTWFGLSYAAYLVLPRTLMQSMPPAWQQRMVACLRELDDAFDHLPRAEAYEVTPGTAEEVGDLTDTQLAAAGVRVERHDTVLLPGADPVPHYNRGRTRLTPAT